MTRNRKPDGHIYELVQSLSPKEKRFINTRLQYLFGDKRKISIWLFKSLLKGDSEKDEVLSSLFRKHFPKSSFIAVKHYLQSYILESLASLKDENILLELSRSTIECRILFNKSLFSNCSKLLNSALKKAYSYEEFLLILELLKVKRDLIIERIPDTIKKDIEDLAIERMKVIELYNNFTSFTEISDELFSLITMYNKNPSAEVMSYMSIILENSLLSDISGAKSFKTQLLYYEVKGLYSMITNKYKAASDYYMDCIRLWEKNSHFQANTLTKYISTLSNYLSSAMVEKEYSKFPAVFDKINKIHPSNIHEELKLFQSTAPTELFYYINIYDYEKALVAVNRMGKKYELYKGKLNKSFEIVLMYNFIHVYFMKGLYEKTLKWTQEMLLNEDSQIRKDLMENARILHMILVFELKNEYQIRSYKRKFKLSVSVSKRLKDLPQRRIFNYLIEINKEKVRKNQMEKIKEVLALLERWKSDPKEINLPGYGELRLWLEAKLHKTTPGVVKIRIDREEPD